MRATRLVELGRKARRGQATPEELQELDRLEQSGRSTARRATGAASRARTSAKGTVTRTRRTAAKRTASTARRASRTADKAADGGSS